MAGLGFEDAPVERRVVLTGALASAAVLAGCGADPIIESNTAATTAADPTPTPTQPTPTRPTPAPANTPTAEPTALPTPTPSSFGGDVLVGSLTDVVNGIAEGDGFLYLPQARAWLVPYPAEHLDAALAAYPQATHAGLEAGLLALHQTCPHLGCRVPECVLSGQLECPCHGSIFTPYGERVSGPAPRGLDLFGIRIEPGTGEQDGAVVIETGTVLEGLPMNTDLTGWEPNGPSCL